MRGGADMALPFFIYRSISAKSSYNFTYYLQEQVEIVCQDILMAVDTKKEFVTFSDINISTNRKGALLAEWIGDKSDYKKAITAHIDTLGAVVKEIKTNGRLKLFNRVYLFS